MTYINDGYSRPKVYQASTATCTAPGGVNYQNQCFASVTSPGIPKYSSVLFLLTDYVHSDPANPKDFTRLSQRYWKDFRWPSSWRSGPSHWTFQKPKNRTTWWTNGIHKHGRRFVLRESQQTTVGRMKAYCCSRAFDNFSAARRLKLQKLPKTTSNYYQEHQKDRKSAAQAVPWTLSRDSKPWHHWKHTSQGKIRPKLQKLRSSGAISSAI